MTTINVIFYYFIIVKNVIDFIHDQIGKNRHKTNETVSGEVVFQLNERIQLFRIQVVL